MGRTLLFTLLSVTQASLGIALGQSHTADSVVVFSLQGNVYDKVSGQPIQDANVSVVGTDGSSFSVITDELGAFVFAKSDTGRYINRNTNYAIIADKEGYLVVKDQTTTVGLTESTTFVKEYFLDRRPIGCPIIPDVQFARNSSELSAPALDTLEIVITILEENPNLVMEIIGYYDQSEPLALALGRSIAVRDHLVKRGIHPGRLVATAKDEASYFVSAKDISAETDPKKRELLRARNRCAWYKVIRTDWQP